MKVLIVSYGWYDYDGRLRELCKVFSKIGDLQLYSNGTKSFFIGHTVSSAKGYFGFIRQAIRYGYKQKDIDVVVIDDRKAIIPGLLVKKILRSKVLIQDCRELYLFKEAISMSSRIGCIIEKQSIHKANIIICANEIRAKIMKDYYNLKVAPIPYENLRELKYSDNVDLETLDRDFSDYFKADEYRILSTSGCSVLRTDDVLVENLKNVEKPCKLFLVGKSNPQDRAKIERIIDKNNYNNVVILDKLDENHLKYLIGKCHIGIVNYSRIDTNSIYCASGKIYEFIYEGLPVVTTTNPPLQDMCDRYNVGIADDNYHDGINKVISNYQFYKEKVKELANTRTVENNNQQLFSKLKERLSGIK